jgi:hypothetical protein
MKVYIDGENLRKSLARVLLDSKVIKNSSDLTTYHLRNLLQDILATKDLDIHYYSSEIRLPNGYTPSDEIMSHVESIRSYSRKWVPNLKLQNIRYIKAGYLKVKSTKPCQKCHTIQETLQEKGVDVRIATDMLEDAYTDKQNTIVIISSDTDLCPALHKVKARNKKVIYVCMADSVNRAVSAVASETITIPAAKTKQYL